MFSFTVCPYCFSQSSTEENEGFDQIATSEADKNKIALALSIGGTAYTATSIALYESWYKNYEQSKFHFYNDWNEWNNMDKVGHLYSAYFQTAWAYHGWKWAGLKENQALFAGAATSFLAQTTIEVFDGFSKEWGFSVPDFASNLIGIGSFVTQQIAWKEQRIRFKSSFTPINYKKRYGSERYQQRANDLFGTNLSTKLFKDYNAQTIWMSLNLKSFFQKSNLPEWLNLAFGYGAENLFGGYSNNSLNLEDRQVKRYGQFYISLDADLSKIDTSSPLLRTLLDVLNIIKLPFSTIEINTLGEVKFFVLKF